MLRLLLSYSEEPVRCTGYYFFEELEIRGCGKWPASRGRPDPYLSEHFN